MSVLRVAPVQPALDGLVSEARYWTVDLDADRVYQQLTATVPAGLKKTGSGSGGGPTLADQSQSVTDQPTTLPEGISYAELDLEVVPTGTDTSAIGAYAQAVAQPARKSAEFVPSDAAVTVTATSGETVTRRAALSATAADRLVHDFNLLPVSTIGETSCPAGDGSEIGATMRAAGHVWEATTGDCGYLFVRVTRDGKQLAVLSGSGPFVADIKRAFGVPPSAAVRRRLAAVVAALEMNGKAFSAQAAYAPDEGRAERKLMGDVVSGGGPVYAIELQGRFVCRGCSHPPGANAPRGSVLIDLVDAHTFRGEDFSMGNMAVPLSEVGVPFSVPT